MTFSFQSVGRLASAAALVVVAGLSSFSAPAQETRLFVDDMGHEVEIPVDPQRIVSLRGEQITAPLIELGAALVGSSGRVDAGVNGGAPYVRGAYDALGFRFENSDVTWVGDPNQYDLEAIALAEPDLILLSEGGVESYEQLSLIAPSVIIAGWEEDLLARYRKIADVAGKLDVYEELLEDWDVRLAAAQEVIAQTVGDPGAVSVGVIEPRSGSVRGFRTYDALTQIIHELGFSMPEAIADLEDARIDVSPELVHEFDADFMISTYWPATGTTVEAIYELWDAAVPNWRDELHAARTNQYFMVHREEMRAVSFAALRSVLNIVVSQIATRGFVPLEAE
ncbi:ABC transporter substrate-binding protein [Pelagibacterium halotolerans]|uniref:Putative iron compound-binding protein of ABC transporter family n=1 Tax=Pelagibacterium halotolerans (strain DSM 22347 / JCM 15775 / CGMCC 1.7692 / B2) TaxID=1082931 RepID=G4R8B4_PELHB|nr:ABC transporter substrate-binding protein [Pelagibacterium halotolerans]AEQ52358.1 putative iron compound-binding protein of ABC transporter family [Pelagibacterium halotolerans B2]QJR17903.1 ABC transporter substrate-binding protein [Pelagibacterium halotolerans]SEA34225.1 iron complex transport system substrate-binding protein [Pelagibacterium halotolerans]